LIVDFKSCLYKMELKELIDFMQRTTWEGKYNYTIEFSKKEQQFAQMIKLWEEYWELCEQVSWALWAQRIEKADRFSQEYLEDEFADVILATIRLACLMDIDIEKALENKKEKLINRMKK
jgi:NTP pyrophosphatase (non-canonical NTP hydrolase)